jgi:hypothetical protein
MHQVAKSWLAILRFAGRKLLRTYFKSPVQITTSGTGNYEMTFDRGKDGRISRATLKPRK